MHWFFQARLFSPKLWYRRFRTSNSSLISHVFYDLFFSFWRLFYEHYFRQHSAWRKLISGVELEGCVRWCWWEDFQFHHFYSSRLCFIGTLGQIYGCPFGRWHSSWWAASGSNVCQLILLAWCFWAMLGLGVLLLQSPQPILVFEPSLRTLLSLSAVIAI